MIVELLGSIDLTVFLGVLVAALITWTYIKNWDLPPGPWGIPILGYLPFLDLKNKDLEVIFNDLSKKYGPVMSVTIGSTRMVVLNSYEAIKEAYVKQGDTFAGRPEVIVFKVDQNDTGVFFTEGEIWKEHRRFALTAFKDFGMGKNSLEPSITEEIQFLTDEIARQNGKPYDFQDLIGMSTANVISRLEFGRRYDYKDEEFSNLRKIMNTSNEIIEILPVGNLIPILKNFDIFEPLTKQRTLVKLDKELKAFASSKMNDHRKNYTEGSRHDYIDAYFTEQIDQKNKTGSVGHFDDNELLMTLLGLFNAGTDTTTTTIRWAILAILVNPQMQEIIQKEIDDVIGMERVPTMSDKNTMPYTDAFLLEAQRFGSITPLGFSRRNVEETKVLGHRIPKHSTIIINQWAVHFDPNLWKNPEQFSPERFINEKRQAVKPEYLIPFGIGKRICMGESLARMEIFLYFVTLLQRFTFKKPEGSKPSLSNFLSKFSRHPTPYEFCAIEREGYHPF